MRRTLWWWMAASLGAIVLALGCGSASLALDVPPAPALSRPVVDTTRTLSDQQIQQLSEQITAARNQKSFQLAVLMVPSLEQTALEDYSLKVARAWGIGERGKNNGVLIVIVKNDRRVRIEVGYGNEGNLTDARMSRLIRSVMAPKFQAGDYYGGIQAAVTDIVAALDGSAGVAQPAQQPANLLQASGALLGIGYFFLVIMSWLVSVFARSKSWWAGGVAGGIAGGLIYAITSFSLVGLGIFVGAIFGGLLLDYVVSKNYQRAATTGEIPAWWAGGTWGSGFGGSSGGDGGGFGGGFGGGDFGGGGASGDW